MVPSSITTNTALEQISRLHRRDRGGAISPAPLLALVRVRNEPDGLGIGVADRTSPRMIHGRSRPVRGGNHWPDTEPGAVYQLAAQHRHRPSYQGECQHTAGGVQCAAVVGLSQHDVGDSEHPDASHHPGMDVDRLPRRRGGCSGPGPDATGPRSGQPGQAPLVRLPAELLLAVLGERFQDRGMHHLLVTC